MKAFGLNQKATRFIIQTNALCCIEVGGQTKSHVGPHCSKSAESLVGQSLLRDGLDHAFRARVARLIGQFAFFASLVLATITGIHQFLSRFRGAKI